MTSETSDDSDKPLLERSASDRRSHTDRRSAVAPWDGVERRKSNRRHAVDRRGLPHGIHYKTNDSLGVLYDWLRMNCYGKWSVGILAPGDNPQRKSVKVLFEMEGDKNNFLVSVVRG